MIRGKLAKGFLTPQITEKSISQTSEWSPEDNESRKMTSKSLVLLKTCTTLPVIILVRSHKKVPGSTMTKWFDQIY